ALETNHSRPAAFGRRPAARDDEIIRVLPTRRDGRAPLTIAHSPLFPPPPRPAPPPRRRLPERSGKQRRRLPLPHAAGRPNWEAGWNFLWRMRGPEVTPAIGTDLPGGTPGKGHCGVESCHASEEGAAGPPPPRSVSPRPNSPPS